MGQVSFNSNNSGRPAPRWWRKLEDGLLMILIPATVAILGGIDFKDPNFAARLTMYVNVGIVALIKFIGKMLANGEVYAQADTKTVETNVTATTTVVDTTKPDA